MSIEIKFQILVERTLHIDSFYSSSLSSSIIDWLYNSLSAEQILTKISTCEEISGTNNILLSKGKNKMEYFKQRDQNNNGGIYELSISLQSLMDIKLLDHLEAEFMVSREGRNFDEYPMSPSFLNDNNSKDTNTKFITHLSQKIDAAKKVL